MAITVTSLLFMAGCSSSESPEDVLVPTTVPESGAPETGAPETGAPETGTAPETTAVIVADVPTPLQGTYGVEVVAALPHDPLAYTQGLEWHDGWLYESTGQYGASDRRRLDPSTGDIDLIVPLDDDVFGEGLTILDEEILQLTWREGRLLRSRLADLEAGSTQRYAGEGWGLCHDGEHLVMSDGSSTLTVRDPVTFDVTARVEVTANGRPVDRLNELECVGQQVLANVYGLDQIVAIDTTSGIVVGVIDAAGLRPEGLSADDDDYVLNGLAYQPETGHWYVTGKYWPVLYEVEFIAE